MKRKIAGIFLTVGMIIAVAAFLTTDAEAAGCSHEQVDDWGDCVYCGQYIGTEWVKVDGKWRYYDYYDGTMAVGWKEIPNDNYDYYWYYFNQDGSMVTGWKKFGKVWYYFKSSGVMATEWQKIGGYWYFFAESFRDNAGVMVTGCALTRKASMTNKTESNTFLFIKVSFQCAKIVILRFIPLE